MTDPWIINAAAGAPEYNAVELRRLLRVLLTAGVADRLGARPGMHPASTSGGNPVTLSGQTVTVHDSSLVIYPGLSSSDGPYLAFFLSHTHVLSPADGSNPRTDIIVARVYDDDHDASGRREAVTEYIAGSPAPSPVPPATPSGALRLATVTVPASGSPAPSIAFDAQFTVANGGVLPVRNESELPLTGIYDGMTVWDRELNMMLVRASGAWRPVSGTVQLDSRALTGTIGTGTAFTVPARLRGLFRSYTLEIDAGSAGFRRLVVIIAGDTGSNYRSSSLTWNNGTGIPSEQNNTNLPGMGALHNEAGSLTTIRFRPRTLGQVSVVSWDSVGYSNAGSTDSRLNVSGGRWAGTLRDLDTFTIRSTDPGIAWSANSWATLWGHL